MKFKNILLTAVLALSGVAYANAYTNGDIVFGVSQVGNDTCYEVDLGSISDLLSMSAGDTKTWQLSTSDLGTIFGTNWANDDTVRWGTAATTNGSSLSVGSTTYADKSVWVTQATAGKNVGKTSTGVGSSDIASLGWAMDAYGTDSSNDSNAVTVSDAATMYSWADTYMANGNASSYGSKSFEAFNWCVTALDDSDGSTLGLYYYDPATSAKGTASTLVGTFTLSDDGVLTYAAVPEPSTYVLLGLGGLALLRRARRRAA
ncbi:MAG: PEP-CTERM sorting domain-containing protein [Chthoniobacteraceae bacterium]